MDNEPYKIFVNKFGIEKSKEIAFELEGVTFVMNQLANYIDYQALEKITISAKSRKEIYQSKIFSRRTIERYLNDSPHDPKKRKK